MENRIGVPSLEIAREGNCPLIMERDTVSNHIVKNRCLNAPWWHNASIGECESWGSNTHGLEIEMMRLLLRSDRDLNDVWEIS